MTTYKFTHDSAVNESLAWLADYRLVNSDLELYGLLEGLILGAAMAVRHPEYLAAFALAASAAEDLDLEGLPAGHSWQEHQDVADAWVDECPWGSNPS